MHCHARAGAVFLGLAIGIFGVPGAARAQEEIEEPRPPTPVRTVHMGGGSFVFELGIPEGWDLLPLRGGDPTAGAIVSPDRGMFILVGGENAGSDVGDMGIRGFAGMLCQILFQDSDAASRSLADGPAVAIGTEPAETVRLQGTLRPEMVGEIGLPEECASGEFILGLGPSDDDYVLFLAGCPQGSGPEFDPVLATVLGSLTRLPDDEMFEIMPPAPMPAPIDVVEPGEPYDGEIVSVVETIASFQESRRYSGRGRFAASIGELRPDGLYEEWAKGEYGGYAIRTRPRPSGFEVEAFPLAGGVRRFFYMNEDQVLRSEVGRPAGPQSPPYYGE